MLSVQHVAVHGATSAAHVAKQASIDHHGHTLFYWCLCSFATFDGSLIHKMGAMLSVASASQERRLLKQVLQLATNCLSFDFMGALSSCIACAWARFSNAFVSWLSAFCSSACLRLHLACRLSLFVESGFILLKASIASCCFLRSSVRCKSA